MAGSVLQQLDAQLDSLFAGWNIYTTLICLILGAFLVYPLFVYVEPDTHPMLLARQASHSYVRQPGESAVYRSLEVPQGYPLRSGLGVKDPGAQKWTAGRDGDLRDIWAQALRGPLDADRSTPGKPGKIISVRGKEEVIEHELPEVTRDINSLGQYLKSHDMRRVAVYLPNSVELVVSIFAISLYGLSPVLLPFDKSVNDIADMLKAAGVDCVIAAAGSFPLEGMLRIYPGLRHVIWVAEQSSRHMDWNEVPEGVGGKAEIAVWHEIVEEKRSTASAEVPPSLSDGASPKIITLSTGSSGPKSIEFTQANIVAAVAAQLSALPRTKKLGSADVLLPLTPLTEQYPLVLTLAALFSNSSVALTSVSGQKADYIAAFRGITPTVLVASPETLAKHHNDEAGTTSSVMQNITRWRQARSLAAGSMPKASSIAPKPRIIYTYERPGNDISPLSPAQLHDLRILTGAHIINAFTIPEVAGAVTQTNLFDYRVAEQAGAQSPAHYGPPLSSLEIKLVDAPGRQSTGEHFSQGHLVVVGPAVAGGSKKVEEFMRMTDSNTLAYG